MAYGDIPKENFRFATGTVKKAPKEWELLFGEDFVLYILKKIRE